VGTKTTNVLGTEFQIQKSNPNRICLVEEETQEGMRQGLQEASTMVFSMLCT
jgi:hypothetical protein